MQLINAVYALVIGTLLGLIYGVSLMHMRSRLFQASCISLSRIHIESLLRMGGITLFLYLILHRLSLDLILVSISFVASVWLSTILYILSYE